LKRDRLRPLAITCSALLLMLLPVARPTFATLGHPGSDIAADQKAMKLQTSKTQTVHGYRIVMMTSSDFSVKEYVNLQSGAVFGVSWSGQRPPDIRSLLGFDPNTIQGPGVYRSLQIEHIETQTLFLEFGGLPGAYSGRAVRLDLLPAGVKASEVTLP
jgi:hypothetical protein